eukprot:Tbor_TRINITY_DN5282_c1_g1::TRINITY_DN5282_c1_g1_i2::g.16557::m.16557
MYETGISLMPTNSTPLHCETTSSDIFITPEDIKLHITPHTNAVLLTGEQKDRLMSIWLEAPSIERQQISMLYPSLFSDSAFVQRIQARIALVAMSKKSQNSDGGKRRRIEGGKAVGGVGILSTTSPSQFTTNGMESNNNVRLNSSEKRASGALVQQTENRSSYFLRQLPQLREAVEKVIAKLSGPGPFTIEFGIVDHELSNKEVIDLFAVQFTQPDRAELGRIVVVPMRTSTRSRKSISGNLSWFIRSVNNNEIACAVSCSVHNFTTLRFVEVPLFATKPGYQRMGLARLLISGLKGYCMDNDLDFILVSSDPKAVVFWTALGFKHVDSKLKSRIQFEYEHECHQFMGSHLMVWKAPKAIYNTDVMCNDYVDEALQKMDQFVLKGTAHLPCLF